MNDDLDSVRCDIAIIKDEIAQAKRENNSALLPVLYRNLAALREEELLLMRSSKSSHV